MDMFCKCFKVMFPKRKHTIGPMKPKKLKIFMMKCKYLVCTQCMRADCKTLKNQQLKEICKRYNLPISRSSNKKFTYTNLDQDRYCLIIRNIFTIQHLSSSVDAVLKKF
jgi:hypothetical protein